MNETILLHADPHMGESSNRIAELKKDFAAATGISPTGTIGLIISSGDYEGISKYDQAHKESVLNAIPAILCPGNHDTGDIPNLKKYQATGINFKPGPAGTEKTSFSFDYGNIHITVLNIYWDGKTNEGSLSGGKDGGEVKPALLAWLKEDISTAQSIYKIVVAHEPMYPDKRHEGNSLDWNIQARDALQNVLQDAGVDMFFAGHTHYARGDLIGNVLQVQGGVVGSKAGTTGDKYRSLWYARIKPDGDFEVTWKHTFGTSADWGNAASKVWLVKQGGTTPPVPGSHNITVTTVPELQDALSHAVSEDKITIMPGTYDLGSTAYTLPANVQVIGTAKETTIVKSTATPYFMTMVSDCQVKNITIKHNAKTIFIPSSSTNFRVENNHFEGAVIAVLVQDLTTAAPTGGHGYIVNNTGLHSKLATLQGVKGTQVKNNVFKDRNGDEFLDLNYNCQECLIEDNTFENNPGYSISQEMIDMVGGNNLPQNGNIIRGNRIKGNFLSGIRPGITTHGNIIENNYIEFVQGSITNYDGIYCYGKGTPDSIPTQNIIRNNTVVGCLNGIVMNSSNDNEITGNTVKNCEKGIALLKHGLYGVDLAPSNNLVSKNTIVVSVLANGIVNEGNNTITSDNVISTTDTPPVETWECEMPLNGYEHSNLGNRRLNPACNPVNGVEFDLSNLETVKAVLTEIHTSLQRIIKK